MGARSAIGVRVAAAAVVFLVALDGGGYSPVSRGTLAICVWWAIALLALTRVGTRWWPPRAALIVGALLAGLTVLTLASTMWADAPEKAFAEFNRAALYLGVFAVVLLLGRLAPRAALVDGLALGIVAVAAVALVSRCFPDLLPERELPRFLPGARTRLSYPVGYWNGLAILAALGVPLLLRAATTAGSWAARGLAAAPVPALVSVVYLASSRGGAITAGVGVLAFVAATARRAAAAVAVLVVAVGSSAAIAILVARPELVDGPLGSGEAAAQGRSAAALLLLACAATGLAHGLASRALPRAPAVPRALAWPAAGVAVALAATALVALEPVEAFRTFKEPPGEFLQPQPNFVRAHLLSGGGSGRWQFWSAAVDEFESAPLLGGGASSYEAWWAEHGSLAYFVRDAHSLYLETLGELGLLGLTLLVAAFGVGLAAGLHSLHRAEVAERDAWAALAATFVSFALAAGVDWMWELTVVSVVGLACLGLLAGGDHEGGRPLRRARAARAGIVVAALFAIGLQAGPLLVELQLRESQAAVRSGDLDDAREQALVARDLEPWAASPYVQLALVEEQAGEIGDGRALIREALERDRADWRLWLVAARLDAKAGAAAEARRGLARARALNPRSPLFAKNG